MARCKSKLVMDGALFECKQTKGHPGNHFDGDKDKNWAMRWVDTHSHKGKIIFDDELRRAEAIEKGRDY